MDSETPNELDSHSYQFYQILFLIVVISQTIEENFFWTSSKNWLPFNVTSFLGCLLLMQNQKREKKTLTQAMG